MKSSYTGYIPTCNVSLFTVNILQTGRGNMNIVQQASLLRCEKNTEDIYNI